ncbi:hypothetical protein [Streptomyces violascens]|uniref:hypothetical protein n=1 Tax=Streptomyces violascens TaxID=67381 RepID=UPI00369AF2B8
MPDYPTPDEARAATLAELKTLYATVTTWDTALLDQVVLHLDRTNRPFGMNDIRLIVPEDACKRAGLYFHGLLARDAASSADKPKLLIPVGTVTSINRKARGKKVNTYLLTAAGRRFIEDRQAARAERRAA